MQLLNDRADLPSESNRAGSPDPQSKPVSQTNTEPQLLLLEAVAEDGFHAGHIDEVARFIEQSGGRVVESRSTSDGSLTYIVLRSDDEPSAIAYALGVRAIPFRSVEPVRLVGAEVDAIQDDGVPRYLVEWDLPDGLDLATYLAGKAAKTPLYAQVPEVTFLRTYVREDMDKCLCFYDGTCEDDVLAARAVVDSPVDRIYELKGDGHADAG